MLKKTLTYIWVVFVTIGVIISLENGQRRVGNTVVEAAQANQIINGFPPGPGWNRET